MHNKIIYNKHIKYYSYRIIENIFFIKYKNNTHGTFFTATIFLLTVPKTSNWPNENFEI